MKILDQLRNKWANRTHIPAKRVKGLIALWSVIIAVSAYEVHNNMVEQYCNREFRASLIARAVANDKAEQASDDELDAVIAWVADFANSNSLPYGPARQERTARVAADALTRFNVEKTKRDAARAEKKLHPIEELRCGR